MSEFDELSAFFFKGLGCGLFVGLLCIGVRFVFVYLRSFGRNLFTVG